MPLLGKAVLAVWNNVDPVHERAFNDWYLRQHVIERVDAPGFLRGRRYRAVDGSPRYFAFYETADEAALRAPAYMRLLENPTDWTGEIMPFFSDTQRSICATRASLGRGIGAAVTAVHFRAKPGQEAALRERIASQILPKLMAMPEIVAAHLWEAPEDGVARVNAEIALRGEPDRPVFWVIVIEATGPDALIPTRGSIRAAGLSDADDMQFYPRYALLFALHAGE
ncbi:MAG: hypothetical protein EXR05_10445 [Acetobacteraceae bacterium]|nr:hypothetical protein [Acetobacteraceae bacterium]